MCIRDRLESVWIVKAFIKFYCLKVTKDNIKSYYLLITSVLSVQITWKWKYYLPLDAKWPGTCCENSALMTSCPCAFVRRSIEDLLQFQIVKTKSGLPPCEHSNSPSGLKKPLIEIIRIHKSKMITSLIKLLLLFYFYIHK